MGVYVMVSADFPKVSPAQRTEIYECLKEKNWIKVMVCYDSTISTTWYAYFNYEINNSEVIEITLNDFIECSKPYTKPRLAIHAGPNKPTLCNCD